MGLVLISHSGKLVEGLREMVAQVAGDDVPVATAGGTSDGRLGTSAPDIAAAIRSTLDGGADDALVLLADDLARIEQSVVVVDMDVVGVDSHDQFVVRLAVAAVPDPGFQPDRQEQARHLRVETGR